MNPTKKPAPQKRYPTPTRHGNWRIVNGQLVEVQKPAPAAAPLPPAKTGAGKSDGEQTKDTASDPTARRSR